MRLAGGILVVLAVTGCAGGGAAKGSQPRAAAPAPARALHRPAAAPARTAPVAGAADAPAAPAEPTAPPAASQPTDSGGSPAPASGQQAVFAPSAVDQVFIRRMLAIIDEVATVMDKQQNACDRMAADLEGIMLRNQDLILMAKQMKGNPARDRWMQEQAMPRLEKAAPRMMAGFQKCQNDPAIQALVRKLGA